MGALSEYQDVLAKAETLSPEDLTRLIGELSKLLQEKCGKWDMLKEVEDVRTYVEWMRFRDSHHSDGRPKSPEEFLAELGEGE
jgi:argininosuccinate lyase